MFQHKALCLVSIFCCVVSCLLFVSSWFVFANSAPAVRPAQIDTDAIAVGLEARLVKAFEEFEAESRFRQERRPVAKGQSGDTFHQLETIHITTSSRGYWLIAPKLMLAVEHLGGGDLRIKFADRFERIRIAERKDFQIDDCMCFLILVESVKGKAVFQFGCEKEKRLEQMAAVKHKPRS